MLDAAHQVLCTLREVPQEVSLTLIRLPWWVLVFLVSTSPGKTWDGREGSCSCSVMWEESPKPTSKVESDGMKTMKSIGN